MGLRSRNKRFFDSQINSSYQKHLDMAAAEEKEFYLIDFENKTLNFHDKECSYCQDNKKLSQLNFEERFRQFNFTKQWPDQPRAHCFGTTLFFVQYLLSNPHVMMHSCADILAEVFKCPQL